MLVAIVVWSEEKWRSWMWWSRSETLQTGVGNDHWTIDLRTYIPECIDYHRCPITLLCMARWTRAMGWNCTRTEQRTWLEAESVVMQGWTLTEIGDAGFPHGSWDEFASCLNSIAKNHEIAVTSFDHDQPRHCLAVSVISDRIWVLFHLRACRW